MAKSETSFLTYKGKPLVRKGNTLYYGDMNDPFVLMLSVADSHEVHGVQIADKVTVQLLNTDPNVNPLEAIVKKAFGLQWISALFGLKERLKMQNNNKPQ